MITNLRVLLNRLNLSYSGPHGHKDLEDVEKVATALRSVADKLQAEIMSLDGSGELTHSTELHGIYNELSYLIGGPKT